MLSPAPLSLVVLPPSVTVPPAFQVPGPPTLPESQLLVPLVVRLAFRVTVPFHPPVNATAAGAWAVSTTTDGAPASNSARSPAPGSPPDQLAGLLQLLLIVPCQN